MENLNINSAVVICDYDLDDNTIKIPKSIDIKNVKYLTRGVAICHRNIMSLDNYTILRTDDNYMHVSPDVYRSIGLNFDGDLVCIF